MAARKTGGLGRGLDALIPNKAGGPSKETAKRTRSTVKKETCGRTSCKNFQCGAESESAEKAF